MQTDTIEADLELRQEATLGECPVWDERENRLYWVDILSELVFMYDPATRSNTPYKVGEDVGSLALCQNDRLLLATQSGFAFFDPEKQKLIRITDPESDRPGNRFNDGKCDPSGNFWAGTLSYDVEKNAGSLYCLNTDLKAQRKLRDLTIPNGMAWDIGRETFYFIETDTRRIYAFDWRADAPGLSGSRILKEIPEEEGSPDGMTIDAEGGLWIALYGGDKVIRLDPASGKVNFEVRLPAPRVTSCTFGGAELNELYITTCRENMSESQIAEAPLSGSLFKAEVPFSGKPAVRFSAKPES